MKRLEFVGSSKKDLLELPDDVIATFGYALDLAQRGLKHDDTKPLKGYTQNGVMEIVYSGADAYRALYSTKIGDTIYVLHCFQKKSPRGKEMPKPDVTTLDARIKAAKALAEKENSDGEE